MALQFVYKTTSDWNLVNPILNSGEPGVELNGSVVQLKIGNGVDYWTGLTYISGSGMTGDSLWFVGTGIQSLQTFGNNASGNYSIAEWIFYISNW